MDFETILLTILTVMLPWCALAVWNWRISERFDRRVDALAKDHQAFARELAEQRGELRAMQVGRAAWMSAEKPIAPKVGPSG